jgi:methionyl-tRNA formyltransferase
MAIVLVKKKMPISVEKEKNEMAIKLLSIKDDNIVQILKIMIDDLTSHTKKTSKSQYNKEIDAAVKRVRSGKFKSNEDVMNEMDKW